VEDSGVESTCSGLAMEAKTAKDRQQELSFHVRPEAEVREMQTFNREQQPLHSGSNQM